MKWYDMAAGKYYDIQYVIFERPLKRSVWKCETLSNGELKLSIIQIQGDANIIAGHIE